MPLYPVAMTGEVPSGRTPDSEDCDDKIHLSGTSLAGTMTLCGWVDVPGRRVMPPGTVVTCAGCIEIFEAVRATPRSVLGRP